MLHGKIEDLIKDAGLHKKSSDGADDNIGAIVAGSSSDPVDTSTNPSTGNPASSSGSTGGNILQSVAGSFGLPTSGGGLLSDVFGGGLIGDLFSGISDLFGGGSSQPPPLVTYQAPQSQDFELAMGNNGQLGDAVYNQYGTPSVAPAAEPAMASMQYLGGGTASSAGRSSQPAQTSSGSTQTPQSITMHIQAMDSQSILDRSDDIASAVQKAMLNMHPIVDVINDL
jgi:hypothetical protein